MFIRNFLTLSTAALLMGVTALPSQAAKQQKNIASNVSSVATTQAGDLTVGMQSKKKETAGQRNAKKKAKSYLSFMSFSRKGLIEQLKFEGFSTKDAKYGVDALKVNWNKQAVKKAKSYLSYSSFSKSGLYDQLIFEGFTPSQAKYGVKIAYK